MVLNTPHDNDCGDDLSWEMVIDVVEAEEELRLVDGNDDDDAAAPAGARSATPQPAPAHPLAELECTLDQCGC